jgi:hypothetical protein
VQPSATCHCYPFNIPIAASLSSAARGVRPGSKGRPALLERDQQRVRQERNQIVSFQALCHSMINEPNPQLAFQTFDLKKSRGKQVIHRRCQSRRYKPTTEGLLSMASLLALRHKRIAA